MPLIKRSCVEMIKERVNILDVVSPYVNLKKSGANWVGLSPFTNEKTPSFYALSDKNIFKCFSSGHAGDIFRFLQLKENLNFQEAIEWVARQHSIELEYEEGHTQNTQKLSLRKEIFEIHEYATDFFAQAFLAHTDEGKFVREYWENERKFSLSLAKSSQIGLSPTKDTSLAQALLKKGYSSQAISESGLFYINKNNTFTPRFKGRLMIPIRDVQSRVIAFTARKLDITPKDHASAEAKYINSPETPIFNKSHVLFGLETARTHVAKNDALILVEGQLDVLRFWENNIFTAIAPQGTSITEGQLNLLKRYSNKLDCFLDGDEAGKKAALRLLPMALKAGIEIRFLSLPDKMDPDSLLQSKGPEALEYYRQKALSPIGYALNQLLPPGHTYSGPEKSAALSELFAIIAECDSQIVKNEYLDEISRATHIERHAIDVDFQRIEKNHNLKKVSSEPIPLANTSSQLTPRSNKLNTAEYELLILILHYPEIAKAVAQVFNVEWITIFSLHNTLLIRFLAELGHDIRDTLDPIDELIETDEERNCVYNILGETPVFQNPIQSTNLCLKTIFNAFLTEQKNKLDELISKYEASTKNEDIRPLLEQRIDLRKLQQNPPCIEEVVHA